MSEYDFTIEYRNTKLHGNCDMLSRLPQVVVHSNAKDECEEIFSMSLEESFLDAEIIAQENKKDHSARRGLIAMVSTRRKLLSYIQRKDNSQYLNLIKELKIRK